MTCITATIQHEHDEFTFFQLHAVFSLHGLVDLSYIEIGD